MQGKYTREQLMSIRQQAALYQCACPAQVSQLLAEIMKLFDYQKNCLNRTDTDLKVHRAIEQATLAAYPIIEQCLTDVLTLEGWDMATLTMPDVLKQKLLDSI
jgi:hypothetical protein